MYKSQQRYRTNILSQMFQGRNEEDFDSTNISILAIVSRSVGGLLKTIRNDTQSIFPVASLTCNAFTARWRTSRELCRGAQISRFQAIQKMLYVFSTLATLRLRLPLRFQRSDVCHSIQLSAIFQSTKRGVRQKFLFESSPF